MRTLSLLALTLATTAACSSPPTFSALDEAGDPDAGDRAPDAALRPDGGSADTCSHSKLTTYGVGPDGVAGTSDDVTAGVEEFDFEPGKGDVFASGSKHRIKRHWDVAGLHVWSWAPNGTRERVVQQGKGPDGKYGTSDDTIVSVNTYETAVNGALVKGFFHGEPGADGVFGTGDDVISGAWRFFATGAVTEYGVYSTAPGPDKAWATWDDLVTGAVRYTTVNGRVVARELAKNAGPDGQPGTADDPVFFRATFPCGGDDVIIEGFDDPGADGTWGTNDDHLAQYSVETGDRCMREECGVVLPW